MNELDFNGKFGEPDEVPYGEICSCNQKNGGSGICGCIMGNKMVPNPKKYGSNNTSTYTTFNTLMINLEDYNKEVDKRKVEDIVENTRKINILSTLIQIVENEHPEFKEENTTGWDLIEGAKAWLEEINNKNK